MATEATASYVASLVSSNPAEGDPITTLDEHIRLIKGAIARTWPNAGLEANSYYPYHDDYKVLEGAAAAGITGQKLLFCKGLYSHAGALQSSATPNVQTIYDACISLNHIHSPLPRSASSSLYYLNELDRQQCVIYPQGVPGGRVAVVIPKNGYNGSCSWHTGGGDVFHLVQLHTGSAVIYIQAGLLQGAGRKIEGTSTWSAATPHFTLNGIGSVAKIVRTFNTTGNIYSAQWTITGDIS